MTVLLNVLVYCVIGLVTMLGVTIIHFYQAEKAGFKCFEWWEKHSDSFKSDITWPAIMIGLIVWPYRVYQAINYIFPEYYSMYERYDDE
jgi:hypothetical protein